MNLLEMSELESDLTRSVKGEIEFPVSSALGRLAAYEGVAKPTGDSKCATVLCHGNETASTAEIHRGKVFVSSAHRPGNSLVVRAFGELESPC